MARTLVLIRHSKAASPDGVPDHERPLTEEGRRDAPAAGRWLRAQGVSPQVAMVSAALRTRQTFELMAAELPDPPEPVVTDDVYYAGAGDLLEMVRALPVDASSAMIVAHNPGIGMLAGALDDGGSTVPSSDRPRGGFPTSSVAVFSVDGDWAALDPGAARLVAFTVARG